MCANSTGRAQAFLSASDAAVSLEVADGKINVQSACALNTRYNSLTRRIWQLSLQLPTHAGSSLADFSTLKIEVIRSSETSVHTKSTRRHIPETALFIVTAVKNSNFTRIYN
jgi:hypothetical protein